MASTFPEETDGSTHVKPHCKQSETLLTESLFLFTESKEDVKRSLLRLMQQRTNQLSLSGEVEGYRTSELQPGQPRDQCQREIQSLENKYSDQETDSLKPYSSLNPCT